MRRFGFFLLLMIIWCSLYTDTSFALGRQWELSGRTMGTFYKIKFISNKKESMPFWQKRVDTLLRQINKRMSMYDPNSELTLFNRAQTNQVIYLSKDLHTVLAEAKKLHTMTGGAWDGTVKPLVDLWGFGTGKRGHVIPDRSQVTATLSGVGFARILLQDKMTAVKTGPVTLDLGSIAKGYGVDAVLHLFTASGIRDVLVEIGGELAATGKNKNRRSWTVGIDNPDKTLAGQGLFKILRLKDQAIATSGDYRNFFEKDGKTYSHIIDPRTGYPTTNNIVSASVISETCMFSDGLATALMVMNIQDGIALVNRLKNTECLIIQKQGNKMLEFASDGFTQLIIKNG